MRPQSSRRRDQHSRLTGSPREFVPPILRTIHTADDVPAKLNVETMAQMIQFATSLVHVVAVKNR